MLWMVVFLIVAGLTGLVLLVRTRRRERAAHLLEALEATDTWASRPPSSGPAASRPAASWTAASRPAASQPAAPRRGSRPLSDAELHALIAQLMLDRRRKIEAIKLLREQRPMSLAAAKAEVERIEAGGPGRFQMYPPEGRLPPGQTEDLMMEVRRLVWEGRKIEAIKLVRERTGLGLKAAKDLVERY